MIQNISYAVIAILIGALLWCNYKLDASQSNFSKYKENINAQRIISEANAKRVNDENQAKYDRTRSDYLYATRQLDSALERLRDAEAMSGDNPLPVAGRGSGTMPKAEANPCRTVEATTFGTRAFINFTEFYEAALRDTQQCKALIDYLK